LKFLKISLLLLVPLSLLALLVVLVTGAASYRVYIIHTGSMSPNIPSGSAVLVHEGHYRIGQVVTFTEDGLTVTHRLEAINSSGLVTTKGDGNATNDPWHVPKSQIIGGVVVAPRYVGYWITYLKDPLGLASVLLAALALWQIWSLTSREDPNAEVRRRPAHRRSRRKLAPVLIFRRTVRNLTIAAEGSAAEVDEQYRSDYAESLGAKQV
jgi:signal peptidase I